MNGLRFAVIVLLLANVATAAGVVYSKNLSRALFKNSRALHESIDQAQIEWGRLQLEESTLARFGRIEELATDKLGMRMPAHDEIKMVLE
jgi:cell division protein FtsL